MPRASLTFDMAAFMNAVEPSDSSFLWQRLRRAESRAGEVRVNLVRLATLTIFYAYHLIHFYLFAGSAEIGLAAHLRITAAVFAWVGLGVISYFTHLSPHPAPWLKYCVTFGDLVLATALVAALGGPQSVFVGLYLIIVAATPLRLSLRFVYATTAGAMVAYLVALGYYAWVQVGWSIYYTNSAVRVPRSQEGAFLLMLVAAGLFAGQVVRQAQRAAMESAMPMGNLPNHDR